jgi:glycosyltransferase involved in cell wall biosynthesis
MKISIAMCTYNGERYVREQLVSIASQTRLPDEMVICDDGSSDRTVSIIANIVSEFSCPVRFQQNAQRLGPTSNFEQAIALCEGEVTLLADQDDIWQPQKLETMAQVFEQNEDVDLVFTDAEIVNENARPLGYRLWSVTRFRAWERHLFERGLGTDVLLRRNVVTGATVAFRTRRAKETFPIPPEWVHDGWIAFLLAATGTIKIIDEPLISYRQHMDQQIGASHRSLKDYIRRAPTYGAQYYDTALRQFCSLRDRLQDLQDEFLDGELLRKINSKVKHLRVCSEVQRGRNARAVLRLLVEYFLFRYRKYSHGTRSAARDLISLILPLRVANSFPHEQSARVRTAQKNEAGQSS